MTGLTTTMIGAGLGAVFGLSLMTILMRSPLGARTRFDQRLAPYVSDLVAPSKLLRESQSKNPLSVMEALVSPMAGRAVVLLERLSGNAAVTRRRLDQAGQNTSLEQFRAQQLVYGVVGTGLGTVLAMASLARGQRSLLLLVLLPLISTVAGIVLRDHLLTRTVTRRRERILIEFPIIAELLALSVSAGEGILAAVQRVARTTTGELSGEFRRALAEVNSGTNITDALQGISSRVELLAVTRFVEGVVISMNRGTPLADVLRAQAQDAREAARRALIEEGGKREISMMVPVVFLVLPITVLFAVFPGFTVLSMGM